MSGFNIDPSVYETIKRFGDLRAAQERAPVAPERASVAIATVPASVALARETAGMTPDQRRASFSDRWQKRTPLTPEEREEQDAKLVTDRLTGETMTMGELRRRAIAYTTSSAPRQTRLSPAQLEQIARMPRTTSPGASPQLEYGTGAPGAAEGDDMDVLTSIGTGALKFLEAGGMQMIGNVGRMLGIDEVSGWGSSPPPASQPPPSPAAPPVVMAPAPAAGVMPFPTGAPVGAPGAIGGVGVTGPIGAPVGLPTPQLSGQYATDYTGVCPGSKKECIAYDDVAGFASHLMARGYVPAGTPTANVLRAQGHPTRRIKVCIVQADGSRIKYDVCVVPVKKPRARFRLTANRVKTARRVMRGFVSQAKLAKRFASDAAKLAPPRRNSSPCKTVTTKRCAKR